VNSGFVGSVTRESPDGPEPPPLVRPVRRAPAFAQRCDQRVRAGTRVEDPTFSGLFLGALSTLRTHAYAGCARRDVAGELRFRGDRHVDVVLRCSLACARRGHANDTHCPDQRDLDTTAPEVVPRGAAVASPSDQSDLSPLARRARHPAGPAVLTPVSGSPVSNGAAGCVQNPWTGSTSLRGLPRMAGGHRRSPRGASSGVACAPYGGGSPGFLSGRVYGTLPRGHPRQAVQGNRRRVSGHFCPCFHPGQDACPKSE
jgi:hypothetical protein